MQSSTSPLVEQPPLEDVPVSPAFRERLHSLVPQVAANPALGPVIWHLLADGEVHVDRGLAESLWPDLRAKRKGVGAARLAHLQGLITEICPPGWALAPLFLVLREEPSQHRKEQVHMVLTAQHTSPALRSVYQDELQRGWWEGRSELVLLGSGHRWSEREQAAYFLRSRAAEQAEIDAQAALVEPGAPEMARITVMRYLASTLTPKTCAIGDDRFEEAMAHIAEHYPPVDDDGGERAEQRATIFRALRRTFFRPWQAFLPSRNNATARLYNGAYPMLPQPIRQILRPNCSIVDLDSAHPRIIAAHLHAAAALRWIRACDEDGEVVWVRMAREVVLHAQLPGGAAHDAPLLDALKPGLKTALLRLCYGGSAESAQHHAGEAFRAALAPLVAEGLAAEGDAEDLARSLPQHPLVSDLQRVVEQRLAEIERTRGASTTWGRQLRLERTDEIDPQEWRHRSRTLLATEIHELEMDLLLPAYHYVEELERAGGRTWVRILSHEHDGLGVWFGRCEAYHRQQIEQRILARAAELGIPTRIKWIGAQAHRAKTNPTTDQRLAA